MLEYDYHADAMFVKQKAARLATKARILAYVNDTGEKPSSGEYDLILAASYLEDAARDLRFAYERIHAMRGDLIREAAE